MHNPAPLAFTYPHGPLARRHGPAGYSDLQSYRPWLRDDFSFRCVYCLIREQWGKQFGEFDLEHFVPVSRSRESSLDYDNLLYACHPCNLRKGDRLVPDPTTQLVAPAIHVQLSGKLSGVTDEARRIIAVMCLNSPNLVRWRLTWMRIIDLCHQHDPELYQALMSYPADLPDLSRLQPPNNTRPQGIRNSYYARRNAGTLPPEFVV